MNDESSEDFLEKLYDLRGFIARTTGGEVKEIHLDKKAMRYLDMLAFKKEGVAVSVPNPNIREVIVFGITFKETHEGK